MTTRVHAIERADDRFDRNSVRRALKSLDDPETLGNHPLAHLNIVRVECRNREREKRGHPDSPVERGIVLRRILCDAIELLKPGNGEPDYLAKPWHPYLILTKQYVTAGRSPDYLADCMCIGRSTYYYKQERALDLLGGILQRMEQHYAVDKETASAQHPPFMSPPRPSHALVGRASLLCSLKQRLFAGGSTAPSALTGLPGVGKTALAIELAHDPEVLAHFEGGILWAGLGRQPDVFALLDTWGRTLGIPAREMAELTTVEERARMVHVSIGLRRMLLIIDDAWQTGAALVFKLGGPNCAHLLTTRIPGIALAFSDGEAIVVHELDEDDGLTLLKRLAPKAVSARQDQARALVQAVGGLPMALTLIGGYLRKESHYDQPRRLREAMERMCQARTRLQIAQPQLLVNHRPDVPLGTPVSLEAVIGISDEAIGEEARNALRALSVFPPRPNSFSEESALAVAGIPTEAVDALLDCGLLESEGEGRYTLHQAIADYAGLRLAENADARQAACGHMISYFIHHVESHARDYAALEPESNNIVTALEIAFEREQWPELVRGASAFSGFLESKGLYKLAETHLTRAEQAARATGDVPGLVTTLRNLGAVTQHLGNYTQAAAYLRESLNLAHETQDRQNTLSSLEKLGQVAFNCGDYEGAEARYREGLALAQEIGDRESHASLLEGLGWVEGCRGDYAQMEAHFSKSMTLAREGKDYARRCSLLISLGLTAANRGNWPYAEMYLQEGLSLARRSGDRPSIGAMLIGLGILELYRGEDPAQAAALIRESLALLQNMERHEKIRHVMTSFSSAHIDHGQLLQPRVQLQKNLALSRSTSYPVRVCNQFADPAPSAGLQEAMTLGITMARTALSLAREIGHRERTGMYLACLGMLEFGLGNYAQARARLQESLALARQTGNHQRTGVLLVCLGAEAVNREDFTQAEAYLQEGLALTLDTGDRAREASSLAYLGVAAAGRGDYARAQEYLEKSLTLAREMGLRLDVHALQASLGAVCLQRGRLAEAEQYLREGPAAAREEEEAETPPGSGEIAYLIGRGDLCLERGDLDSAGEAFEEVSKIAREREAFGDAGARDWAALALYGLAHVAAARGEVAEARRLGRESREVFGATGSCRADEVEEWLDALSDLGS